MIVNLTEFENPLELLLKADIASSLKVLYDTIKGNMSQNPSSQWEKLLSSFLCVTFTLCSSKTGRGILGPIFLKEFVNGIINETNLFLRRQCAENVCALFKNNNENKDLFAQDKENIQTM